MGQAAYLSDGFGTHLASVHEEITDLRRDMNAEFAKVDIRLTAVQVGLNRLEAKIDHVDEKLGNFRLIAWSVYLFATPNSLKSQRAQKVLTPYSNTHAVRPKLYSFSTHMIAILRLRARVTSPYRTRRSPRISRFRSLALFGRRPHERGDRYLTPTTENLHRSRHPLPGIKPLDSRLASQGQGNKAEIATSSGYQQ